MARNPFGAADPLEGVSQFQRDLISAVLPQRAAPMQKAERRNTTVRLQLADPNSTDFSDFEPQEMRKGVRGATDREPPTLAKSILKVLNGPSHDSIERLAFESDPRMNNLYASVYKTKLKLIPDNILKRIAIQDDLVASIVNTRAAQIQCFGRPQPDRHSMGFKIQPDDSRMDKLSPEEKKQVELRIDKLQKMLITCGHTRGWKDKDRMTFAQFLGMVARNAVTVGRIAVEVIYQMNDATGKRDLFHSFRPIDAGTIYRAAPFKSEADAVRKEAASLMATLKNQREQEKRPPSEDYAFVQVVDGKPVQVFTEDECLVHNFYPVADVELDGYPVTPIDTAIAAVTTHINITTHNRLYFQSGRAARGMLVIKSEDVDENTIARIKHQFQASINNVANSWRMPVFAVDPNDDISWQAIDAGARDMEFQYLSDTNARVIMSAFQISPEELPGYQHLSRGTNNQALSESNNEYKLEAARDVGIRPLVAQFEDFLNERILPLLDENLAKFCVIKFVGLDAETPEKENVRLQESQQTFMSFDDVLTAVEKKPMGPQKGGTIPLNPLYQQLLDSHFTMGQRLEWFCGVQGASKDPNWAYPRDPFWFQNQQMINEKAQAAAGQPPGGGDGGGEGGPPQQGEEGDEGGGGGDLSTGIGQAIQMFSKSEAQLPPSRRRLLEQHTKTVDKAMEHMRRELADLTGSVISEASKHVKE